MKDYYIDKIEDIEERIDELEGYSEDDFDDYLDEVYGEVELMGVEYRYGKVLQSVDEIAYSCAYTEYIDREISSDIDDITSDIDNLRDEIDDEENMSDDDKEELEEMLDGLSQKLDEVY